MAEDFSRSRQTDVATGRRASREASDALKRFPKDPDALYAAGLAYEARGDATLAAQYLQAYLETGPEMEMQIEVHSILQAMKQQN